MNSIVYDSDDLQVIYAPGTSDYLLITFSALNDVVDGQSFWGKRFVESNGIATIGIVARKVHGWPTDEIEATIKAAAPILSRYDEIITFGTSMGAYGALKHSRRLGARIAIAFAPFYGAHPSDIGQAESRRLGYLEADMRGGDAIGAEDLCARAIVFYDPYFVEENKHAALIRQVSPAIHMIPAPNTQHFPVALFAKSEVRLALIAFARAGSIENICELTRAQRKLSPVRVTAIVEKIAETDPKFARHLLKEYSGRLFSQQSSFAGDQGYAEFKKAVPKFALRISDVARRVGELDLAVTCAQVAVTLLPESPAGYERLIMGMIEADRVEEARAIVAQAAAAGLDVSTLEPLLAMPKGGWPIAVATPATLF